jgi:putative transposase
MTAAKTLPADVIDSLLSGYKKPEDLIGEDGLLKQITKALVERALAEMESHLGHAKDEAVTNPVGNTRNGKSRKTLKVNSANCPSRYPVTATVASNLS